MMDNHNNKNHTPSHQYQTRSLRKTETKNDKNIQAVTLDGLLYSDSSSSDNDCSDCISMPQNRKSNRNIRNSKTKQIKKTRIKHDATNSRPEWINEVIPRQIPYYPQMGDDIVYFKQGHQNYLEITENKSSYEAITNLNALEFCKIIGITYGEPHICCLDLAITDKDGLFTGDTFSIEYNYVPDVPDFLVLKQTFHKSMEQCWMIGMKFRYINSNFLWQIGKIQTIEPFDKKFPDSCFLCFRVKWNNGHCGLLSPWNIEPIDESNLPEELGGTVPLLPTEIHKFIYQPKPEEWPTFDRETCCHRILVGFEQVMKLPIAEHFIAPVDLSIYPEYARVVHYPVDLTMIKHRLENNFYRRIAAIKFDIRYIERNAKNFNHAHNQIVKNAKLVTDICLYIIENINEDLDVGSVYTRLRNSSNTETDVCDNNGPTRDLRNCTLSSPRKRVYNEMNSEIMDTEPSASTSARPSSCKKGQKTCRNDLPASTKQDSPCKIIGSNFRKECKRILRILWSSNDSIPFRHQVDILENPDYYRVINTPICLQIISEELEAGNYKSISGFQKDVNLMLSNSKKYNQDTNSEIYKQTYRLSKLFDDIMNQYMSFCALEKERPSKEKENSAKKSKNKTIYSSDYIESSSNENLSSVSEDESDIYDPPWVMDSDITEEETDDYSQLSIQLSQVSTNYDLNSENDENPPPIRNSQVHGNNLNSDIDSSDWDDVLSNVVLDRTFYHKR